MISFQKRGGFTLIEIMAAVAIMVILATIVWGAFYSFRRQAALEAASENVIALLNQARAKTLASQASSEFGVHFESVKAVMFKGAVYSATSPDNEEFILPLSVEISAVSLEGGGSDIFFEKFSANASKTGSITLRLKSDVSKTKNIVITKTGLVYAEN